LKNSLYRIPIELIIWWILIILVEYFKNH
jgi:hypothetical protein